MLKIVAAVVDHPLTRVLLGLFGIVVTALFGLYAVILLLVNPLENPGSFATGLGATLGLFGWWARLFLRSAVLARRPWAKAAVAVSLLAGVSAACHALAIIPEATTAFPILVGMVGAGALMFLGTIGGSGPGPNSSFKPKPLRGSA